MICESRYLILVMSCLMEGSLVATVLDMLEDVPHQCVIVKDLSQIFWLTKSWGLSSLHLMLWLFRDICCTK